MVSTEWVLKDIVYIINIVPLYIRYLVYIYNLLFLKRRFSNISKNIEDTNKHIGI